MALMGCFPSIDTLCGMDTLGVRDMFEEGSSIEWVNKSDRFSEEFGIGLVGFGDGGSSIGGGGGV